MPRRFRPALEPVEARLTPALTRLLPDGATLVPAGGGAYRVIEPTQGSDIGTVTPFGDGYAGEVRTATGDVTGDGNPDLIVAAGTGGGPRVRVFDGLTAGPVADFFAFEAGFRGGVNVAAADVTGDGKADIVVGAGDGGGPRVRVFDGTSNGQTVLADFLAFEPGFRGGARVAAGDVDGDGSPELIAGAGAGGSPRVAVFRPGSATPAASFLAYDAAFRGGVYVATAGADSSFAGADRVIGAEAKIVTGPGVGGGPVAKVFSGTTGEEYFAFPLGDPASRAGLRVTGNQAGVTGASPGPAGPRLEFSPWYGGQTYWALPPGNGILGGTLAAVDPTARTVRVRSSADTPSQTAGTPPQGVESSFAVAADATVRLNGLAAALADLQPGDEVTVRFGPDGVVNEVRAVRLGPVPTPVPVAPPLPDGGLERFPVVVRAG